MSTMPLTTSGRSVQRSSSAERSPLGKSPYSESSPAKVEVPRLWYIVGSLSHAGTFTSSWPAGTTGVYGNETAGSIAGNVSPSA